MTIFRETVDLPKSTATDALMLAGDALYGTISALGDRDWIGVDLLAGQTYAFAAVSVGQSPLDDPKIYLRGPDPSQIADLNDDSLMNLNAVLIYTATTTGRHYLEIGDADTGTGDYGVTMTAGRRPDFLVPMVAGVIRDQSSQWADPQLSYSFRVSGNNGSTRFTSTFDPVQQATITAVLAYFAEVAHLTFDNRGETNAATMIFANYSADDGVAAYAYAAGDARTSAVDGDVWNNTFNDGGDYGFGGAFYETMLHEVGHSMGLTHPGTYDAAQGPTSYRRDAQFTQDSEALTVMSYFAADETGGSDLNGQTLAIADILALQNIYGANDSTRGGNTTYGYNADPSADDIYDFTLNLTPKFTIWDGGGTDTIDLSGSGDAQRINLNDGTLSDILGYLGNIGIAVGARIENAFGGAGADTILGNALDNVLDGGAGGDLLYGGAGADTLDGNSDADTLFGGAGDDIFYVDDTQDIILETVGGGYDRVLTTVSYDLAFGLSIQELRATGGAALDMGGNESSNRLIANSGENRLTGGGGADVFVFETATAADGDTLTDFAPGQDKIDLSLIDADTAAGNQAFAGLATVATANSLWWARQGADVVLRGDITGDTTADFALLITGQSGLTLSHVIL